MESLWNDAEAGRFAGPLGQRIYTSRLLGRERSLVLHGGGNTSVKLPGRDLLGDEETILHVKGSGVDLAQIDESGFSPVRLSRLLRLVRLPAPAPGSIEVYSATAISGWRSSLLVTGMCTGIVYRVKLSDDGTAMTGAPLEYFRRANRYRDTAVGADGRRIFVVTDRFGTTSDEHGQRTEALAQPGALLEFTYVPSGQKER